MLYPHIDKYDINVPEDDDEVAGVTALLTVVVKDKHGNIKTAFTKPSHSPTKNFVSLLGVIGNVNGVFTNTSNSLFGSSGQQWMNIGGPFIAVGGSSNSNPFTAYNLASPISNGTGSGQLLYGSVNVTSTITVSGSSAYFSLYSTFTNASSVTVNVTEIGILIPMQIPGNFTWTYFLIWYDTIPSISLAPGDTLTVTYTFTINP